MADQWLCLALGAIALLMVIVMSNKRGCPRCGSWFGCSCFEGFMIGSPEYSQPSQAGKDHRAKFLPGVPTPKYLQMQHDSLTGGGYMGLQHANSVHPADHEMNSHHQLDHAYDGHAIKQIGRPMPQRLTNLDNGVLPYGVVQEEADDSSYGFLGPAHPVDQNLERWKGVM